MSYRPEDGPLSICFFAHLPGLAGAERTLLELVTQLIQDHGVSCTVVVPGEGPLLPRLESAGAEVIPERHGWWCSSEPVTKAEVARRTGESLARLNERILPALRRLDPDLICTQTIVTPYGALAAAELGVPHIWNLREYGEPEGFHFFTPFSEVSDFVRRHSDFVFGANRSLCQEVVPGLAPDRYDVLYPAIEIPNRGLEDEDAGDGRFFGTEALRLAEFATVTSSKRIDVVVQAVAELTDRGRSVELLIAGSQVPDCLSDLERLARRSGVADRIRWAGFLDHVFEAMAEADAVAISAPVHALGRSAVEGMLMGKPVVYPLGTGFDDYIDDGVTGLGYTARDATSMADRIDLLIEDPNLGQEIGRRASLAARAHFSRAGFADKFYRRAVTLAGRSKQPA